MNNTATLIQITQEMKECLLNCLNCYSACARAEAHCLQRGGPFAEAGHIIVLQDCGEICQTSAGFLVRGSATHQEVCGVCAEVCRRCAEECEGMPDDRQLKECAEACRTCADSCEQMARV